MNAVTYAIARLTEASSHAGIAMLLQAMKAFLPQWAGVIDAASALFAALAVAIPSGTHAPQA